jgi:hypothetical protein
MQIYASRFTVVRHETISSAHGLQLNTLNFRFHLNPLNANLNPICHLLALLGAHHILHVSRIRVNSKYHDLYT